MEEVGGVRRQAGSAVASSRATGTRPGRAATSSRTTCDSSAASARSSPPPKSGRSATRAPGGRASSAVTSSRRYSSGRDVADVVGADAERDQADARALVGQLVEQLAEGGELVVDQLGRRGAGDGQVDHADVPAGARPRGPRPGPPTNDVSGLELPMPWVRESPRATRTTSPGSSARSCQYSARGPIDATTSRPRDDEHEDHEQHGDSHRDRGGHRGPAPPADRGGRRRRGAHARQRRSARRTAGAVVASWPCLLRPRRPTCPR